MQFAGLPNFLTIFIAYGLLAQIHYLLSLSAHFCCVVFPLMNIEEAARTLLKHVFSFFLM